MSRPLPGVESIALLPRINNFGPQLWIFVQALHRAGNIVWIARIEKHCGILRLATQHRHVRACRRDIVHPRLSKRPATGLEKSGHYHHVRRTINGTHIFRGYISDKFNSIAQSQLIR